MVRYVKCPRCELNYIDGDKQEYCDVCLAEMRGSKLQFADLDEDEYEEIDSGEELCPICGVNRMRFGETMCDACKKERGDEYEEEQEEEVDIDKDEEWKNYLDEEESDDLTVDDEVAEELEEEFGDKEEEEEEFYDGDPLDDELDDLGDLDDEDDEDDDDDEDDEDDDDDLF